MDMGITPSTFLHAAKPTLNCFTPVAHRRLSERADHNASVAPTPGVLPSSSPSSCTSWIGFSRSTEGPSRRTSPLRPVGSLTRPILAKIMILPFLATVLGISRSGQGLTLPLVRAVRHLQTRQLIQIVTICAIIGVITPESFGGSISFERSAGRHPDIVNQIWAHQRSIIGTLLRQQRHHRLLHYLPGEHRRQHRLRRLFRTDLNDFGWTRAMTSGAFSLSWVMNGLLGIVMGRRHDRSVREASSPSQEP